MSSPATSRSSTPSLDSVTDISESGSAPPVAPTDVQVVVNLPSIQASATNFSAVTSTQLDKAAAATASKDLKPHFVGARRSSHLSPDGGGESMRVVDLEAQAEKHERYFFTDDFLTFLVDGTLYRLHSFMFTTASPYWAQEVARGDRNAKPIYLENVSKNDMDAFLSTLYPLNEQDSSPRSWAEWGGILHLATLWQFEYKRNLAIVALETIASDVQKLALARAHNVEAWLQPAFVALCLRPAALNLKEAECLPLRDVLHIMSAREALYKGRSDSPSREDASLYVENHILASSSPGSPQRQQTFFTSTSLVELSPKRPSPGMTLSECPTVEEKRAFATLFSRLAYGEALQAVQPHNVQAFCDLLADFSGVSKDAASFFTFLRALLSYSASDPSFIPVGTQLLKALVLALPLPLPPSKGHRLSTLRSEFSQDDAKSQIRLHRDGIQKFWTNVEKATVKHSDLALAIAHAMSSDDREGSVIFGRKSPANGIEQAAVYEQRSKNFRAFFAALADAGLLEK